MLLNIDRPLGTATLHVDSCPYVPDPFGTRWKPVGQLGRDGGWFRVASGERAEKLVARTLPSVTLRRCSRC